MNIFFDTVITEIMQVQFYFYIFHQTYIQKASQSKVSGPI